MELTLNMENSYDAFSWTFLCLFSFQVGVEQLVLGTYVIRGDNVWVAAHCRGKVVNVMCVRGYFGSPSIWSVGYRSSISFKILCCWFRAMIGEIDGDLDRRTDLGQIRAPPLKPISHFWNKAISSAQCAWICSLGWVEVLGVDRGQKLLIKKWAGRRCEQIGYHAVRCRCSLVI